MFTEKPCMAQTLCSPGDYLPESLHREAWQVFSTMLCLHSPLMYLCSLLCSSSNDPKDLKTSSLDFNKAHFSCEAQYGIFSALGECSVFFQAA